MTEEVAMARGLGGGMLGGGEGGGGGRVSVGVVKRETIFILFCSIRQGPSFYRLWCQVKVVGNKFD